MPTRIYLSSDASAPALSMNVAASVAGVLDAILVNGYGAKPSLGWTKPYASGNAHVYRSGGTGDRFYFRLNSTGMFGTHIRGYRDMTGASTGTNPFPTLAQHAGEGMNVSMGNNTGNNNCAWACVGNEYFFDFWTCGFTSASSVVPGYQTTSASNLVTQYQFGRFKSYVVGDVYNHMIQGNGISGALSGNNLHQASSPDLFVAANPQGTVDSINVGRHYMGGSQVMGAGGYPYVDPHTGALRLQSKVRLLESNLGAILWRGEIPGLAFPLSDVRSLGASNIVGSGSLAGKTFFALPRGDANIIGYHCYDLDDWGN